MYTDTTLTTATMTILTSADLIQGAVVEKRYTVVDDVQRTYGFPDNNAPSADIAYDCGRGYKAGDKGTYDDPRAMATAPSEVNKCEIIWDFYTEKYLISEDICA
ncbi:hypothetical protein DOTSEDRAFT_69082 [Dothistroma septosporum NZE10]|uniref:Uncharacterized protein n=1 Tax=Dothistroma septosporum (strain NZE10 / CBS 128990) TaxID=675120 RepID=N1PXM4_DOTSN|nr:hypothetical protein DOTSEDRAFT_69082 [Dothistroma septosporum NZE10]